MRSASTRLIAPLLLLSLSACSLPYYMHAAAGQVRLLRQRTPIADVIADPVTDARTREQLELVTAIREFAFAELALPESDSYTSYVDLERDAVVWNVVAAGEFSVEPVTWCFPVAGCVAYRGYFELERAEAFGSKLEQRGFDTFVGGSAAYSTLGHFDDPVLNTMLARGDTEVAAMLFHELAHQRLYVKDDTQLSESFATAVEQFGVEEWLDSRDDDEALDRYRRRLGRQREFAGLVAEQRDRLAMLFAQELPADTLRRQKADSYAQMRRDYESLRARWDGARDYDGWFEGEFNNARLVALTSYQRWVPGLKSRLARLGPARFYEEVAELSGLAPGTREATLEAWNASAMAALSDQGQLVDAAGDKLVDDRFHRLRLDAECREPVFAADAGDGQRTEIVPAERLAGQEVLADPCLQPAERPRQIDQRPPDAEFPAQIAEDLLERVDVRPAQLVSPAETRAVGQRANEGLGDVVDVDRGKARIQLSQG